jgi:apolipoprotein N-acyltransferase
VLGAAFLNASWGLVACGAFVPLLVVLERTAAESRPRWNAFRWGYLFGFVFFLVGMHWIARLSNVAITVPWLKYPAWLMAAAYLAVYPALACALAVGLARRSGFSLAATFPPAFLVVEELRASGELGFPWFQPGYAVHAYPRIIQLASLGGVALLTVWVLIVNVLLWRALPLRPAGAPSSSRALAAAGLLAALLLPWAWGGRALKAADTLAAQAAGPRGQGADTSSIPARPGPIALIQANIPGEIKWSGQHQGQILESFLSLSRAAGRATPKPSLIVWPETATGTYLRRQLDQTVAVAELAASTGVPIFTGFADYSWDSVGTPRYWNAAGMFAPDGSLGPRYAKRHLVPFGERMPFQRWLPMMGKIELGQAEWTAGETPVLFPGPFGPFSCLVCFEAIFPDLARDDVRHGARMLVNITNDEWFGNSVALTQHAGMAVLRAVENHVPLARCANTGLTLLIDASGRVRSRLPVFQVGVLTGDPGPPGRPTPFTQLGDWPGMLGWATTLLLVVRRWRA